MNRRLSKHEIQQIDDQQVDDVDVPEWGGSVRVRGLTGEERDAYEASLIEERKRGGVGVTKKRLRNARARLIVMAAVDDAGDPLFTTEDIPWLGQKSARAVDRLAEKARELSGMTEQDEEELLGNSDADPSDGSTSGSPNDSA